MFQLQLAGNAPSRGFFFGRGGDDNKGGGDDGKKGDKKDKQAKEEEVELDEESSTDLIVRDKSGMPERMPIGSWFCASLA